MELKWIMGRVEVGGNKGGLEKGKSGWNVLYEKRSYIQLKPKNTTKTIDFYITSCIKYSCKYLQFSIILENDK